MKLLKFLTFISIFLAWLYAASLPLQGELLVNSIKESQRTYLMSFDWPHTQQISVMSANLDKQFESLAISTKVRDQQRIKLWNYFVKLRPISPVAWISLSNALFQTEQKSESMVTIKLAETLGWRRTEYLKPIMAQYYLLDDIPSLKRIAQRILKMDIRETYPIYQILKQSISDREIFKTIIPKMSFRQERSREKYAEYWKYLYFGLISKTPPEKKAEMIDIVWKNANLEDKNQMLMHGLAKMLLNEGRIETLNKYLEEIKKGSLYTGDTRQLSFAKKENMLCWERKKTNEVRYLLADEELKIQFSPDWELGYSHLSCYLPLDVKYSGRYTISGSWSGFGFSDELGANFVFRARKINSQNKWSKYYTVKTPNYDWTQDKLKLDLQIDQGDQMLELRFVRFPGKRTLYARPFAEVALSDFFISKAGVSLPTSQ